MDMVRFDFPLCADESRGTWIRQLLKRGVAYLLEEVGTSAVEAVILTGSLARGEGSILLCNGAPRLLGDAEFLVIFRQPFDFRSTRRKMAEVSRQATQWIGGRGALAQLEFSPAGIGYLRQNARPAIFTYDLLHHGKVVWGRKDTLSEMQPFDAKDIPQEDALKLLMNRMVEQLQLTDLIPNGDRHTLEDVAYHFVKAILDMAGSALAFSGRYDSPYAERPERLAQLLEASLSLRTTLGEPSGFTSELKRAAQLKLWPTDATLFPGCPGEGLPELRAYLSREMERLAQRFVALWIWEVRELISRPEAEFSQLVAGYVRREPLVHRLKGWAKLYLHPLRPRKAVSPWRVARDFWRASPQTLTYGAAVLAYAGLSGQGPAGNPAWAARLLPSNVPEDTEETLRKAIGELWTLLIRNN